MRLHKDPESFHNAVKMAEEYVKGMAPNPRPGQLFTAVWAGPARVNLLDKPTNRNELSCPRCAGTRGYTVRGGIPKELVDKLGFGTVLSDKEVAWACNSSECLDSFLARPMRSQQTASTGINERLQSMGFPKAYLSVLEKEWNQRDEVVRFGAKYARMPDKPLMITGPNGTGKTFTACRIGALFVKNSGSVARFWNTSSLSVKWRELSTEPRSLMHFTISLSESPILILDDLGIRCPTDAFMDFLYQIINNRDEAMLPTIVTTNLDDRKLSEQFGNAISSRIGAGFRITLDGKDRR